MDCLATLSFVPTQISPEPTDYWQTRKTYFQRMQGSIPSSAVLFHGDSNIDALCVSAAHPAAVNLGVGGESMRACLNRIQMSSIHDAAACVIGYGLNDLAYSGGQWQNGIDALKYMHEYILKPAMLGKWVVCNILNVGNQTGPVPNSSIDSVNSFVQTLYSNYSGPAEVAVVDVSAQLAPQGYLLPQYHIGDDIHLNGAGQAVWITAISAALSGLGV